MQVHIITPRPIHISIQRYARRINTLKFDIHHYLERNMQFTWQHNSKSKFIFYSLTPFHSSFLQNFLVFLLHSCNLIPFIQLSGYRKVFGQSFFILRFSLYFFWQIPFFSSIFLIFISVNRKNNIYSRIKSHFIRT